MNEQFPPRKMSEFAEKWFRKEKCEAKEKEKTNHGDAVAIDWFALFIQYFPINRKNDTIFFISIRMIARDSFIHSIHSVVIMIYD